MMRICGQAEIEGADRADQARGFRVAGRDPQHNCRRWFNEALSEAKIEGDSWHCNRHTFASRLVMAGVDLCTVAETDGPRQQPDKEAVRAPRIAA